MRSQHPGQSRCEICAETIAPEPAVSVHEDIGAMMLPLVAVGALRLAGWLALHVVALLTAADALVWRWLRNGRVTRGNNLKHKIGV